MNSLNYCGVEIPAFILEDAKVVVKHKSLAIITKDKITITLEPDKVMFTFYLIIHDNELNRGVSKLIASCEVSNFILEWMRDA